MKFECTVNSFSSRSSQRHSDTDATTSATALQNIQKQKNPFERSCAQVGHVVSRRHVCVSVGVCEQFGWGGSTVMHRRFDSGSLAGATRPVHTTQRRSQLLLGRVRFTHPGTHKPQPAEVPRSSFQVSAGGRGYRAGSRATKMNSHTHTHTHTHTHRHHFRAEYGTQNQATFSLGNRSRKHQIQATHPRQKTQICSRYTVLHAKHPLSLSTTASANSGSQSERAHSRRPERPLRARCSNEAWCSAHLARGGSRSSASISAASSTSDRSRQTQAVKEEPSRCLGKHEVL